MQTLTVNFGDLSDGRVAAFSTESLAFCFIGHSEEELKERVRAAVVFCNANGGAERPNVRAHLTSIHHLTALRTEELEVA